MNQGANTNKYLILYGTQTGTAEDLAEQLSQDLDDQGISHSLENMFDITLEKVKSFQRVFIIVSTWGDGDPPDDAEDLLVALQASDRLYFAGSEFTVFGLGDTNYDYFCKCAVDFDEALTNAGASQIIPLVKADLEFDDKFDTWSQNILNTLPSMVEQ
ncbi:MAG: flavodoxin domain-containing protein [Akkermansiaceae bacterium]